MARHSSLVRESTEFSFEGTILPVEIYLERRYNARISCGVDRLHLRIPKYCSEKERKKFIRWGEAWAEKMWHLHPWFRARFRQRLFGDGQLIQTNYDRFELCLEPRDIKHYRGKLHENQLLVAFPVSMREEPEITAIYQVVHKLLAIRYRDFICQKVVALNELHFQKEITDIRIRLQKTRWGSCSSNGKISLSTKLLFAPEDVLDYVIVHELAHLIEHNHSRKYWKLVENAMPDYGNKERWLKKYGHLCDF